MEWYAAYLALGAISGYLAGMFGIGGGIIVMPVLMFLFDALHFPDKHLLHLSLGTSMAAIMFTSFSSMLKHHQHKAVIWTVVFRITPGILLGTIIGAVFATSISPHYLGLFFACFVYCVAVQILIDVRPHASRQLPGPAGMTLVGTLTGWLGSMVSIGGGTVIVPFLVWCNVSLRHAIGTSAAIGFPVAAGGTLGYVFTGMSASPLPAYSLGFVYLPALFWIALACVFTAPIGARATHHMNMKLLRKLFSLLLLILGTKLLLKVI